MTGCVQATQLLSLLRDYDLAWPQLTISLLSYSDSFNVGISIVAPACFVKGYDFFVFYVATMAQPVRSIACAAGGMHVCFHASRQRVQREPCNAGAGDPAVRGRVLLCQQHVQGGHKACSRGGASPAALLCHKADAGEARQVRGVLPQDEGQVGVRRVLKGVAHPSIHPSCLHAGKAAAACRCYKNIFYLVTLVYPRCAQTCLQLFSYMKLDIGTYLYSDFTILVRDTSGRWAHVYLRYLFPGIAVLLVFAIGLPIWYLVIMYLIRDHLQVWQRALCMACCCSLHARL